MIVYTFFHQIGQYKNNYICVLCSFEMLLSLFSSSISELELEDNKMMKNVALVYI